MSSRASETDSAPELEHLREQVRSELEEEHQERLRRFAERRKASDDRSRDRHEIRQRKQLEQIRYAERQRFYQEQGYKAFVDSNGRSEWLPPEEYEWRTRRHRKKHRRGHEHVPNQHNRRRELTIYLIAAVAAVLIGILLTR
ncbi:MAG: hypothetical protein GXP62_12370 [Oligoflexia bacterium]|nr:hypothetical protein [Oligoflexia bacterium]